MNKTILLGLLALGSLPFFSLACSSSGADSFTGNRDCSVSGVGCKTACDSTLGCVECTAKSDCGAANPICVVGHCRQCGVSGDCGTGQACYPANHTCAPACNGPGSCPQGNSPICDPGTGACVGCVTDKDCPAQRPVCEPTTQQCSQCASNADCGTAKPICDVAGRECVQCLVDGQCPTGSVCNENSCRAGCKANSDCTNPERPVCLAGGQCGQCAKSSDCPAAAPICTAGGVCSQCGTNADCPAASPLCDGERCVQCINDKDCAANLKCQNRQCVAG